jgi:hypothetical protein
MMHPATELRFLSREIGHGVFALESIPTGTITWTADPLDQRLTLKQVGELPPQCAEAVRRYAYVDPGGVYVLCWDHGRYVNHSCEPNCLSAGFQFEFAIRDIAEGEQLTDDYGLMNLGSPLHCRCGMEGCRQIIGEKGEYDIYASFWDRLVEKAFPHIGSVNQPLWPLVGCAAEIEAVLRGKKKIPSCTSHRLRD